jgi:diadenosine tetraphosphatase ApaH/serine/threonine PP2A family protein phosphatase
MIVAVSPTSIRTATRSMRCSRARAPRAPRRGGAWATSSATAPSPTRWSTRCAHSRRSRSRATTTGPACGKVSTRQFNKNAALAAAWTAQNTSAENLAWLAALPLVATADHTRLVHATPSAPEEWNYCMRIDDAWLEMKAFEEMVCMIGPLALPGVFEKEGEEIRYTRAPSLRLREGRQYLVNVGSVGQPRDGDPRAGLRALRHRLDAPAPRARHLRRRSRAGEDPRPRGCRRSSLRAWLPATDARGPRESPPHRRRVQAHARDRARAQGARATSAPGRALGPRARPRTRARSPRTHYLPATSDPRIPSRCSRP